MCVPIYLVFLAPEIFNFTLVTVAYFLWLYKEVAPAKATTPQSPTWALPLTLKLVKPRTVRVQIRDEVNQQPIAGVE